MKGKALCKAMGLALALVFAGCGDSGGGGGGDDGGAGGDDGSGGGGGDGWTCSDLTLDESREYDVAGRPLLLTFDMPAGFTDLIGSETDGERSAQGYFGFPESESDPNHVIAQYQLSQGDTPLEDPSSSLETFKGTGYETWDTLDWNGEDVEVIVGEPAGERQAKMYLPYEISEGKRYFSVTFQHQTFREECAPEIESLLYEMLATFRPNPETSFAE